MLPKNSESPTCPLQGMHFDLHSRPFCLCLFYVFNFVPHCGVHKGCILSTILELQLFFYLGLRPPWKLRRHKRSRLKFSTGPLFGHRLRCHRGRHRAFLFTFLFLCFQFLYRLPALCHCAFFVIFPFIFNPPSYLFVVFFIIFYSGHHGAYLYFVIFPFLPKPPL